MPLRDIPLVTGEYYHVFNRGNNKQPIFLSVKDYKHALDIFEFYSFSSIKLRFSRFIKLSKFDRELFWDRTRKENKKFVDIICFCLMPNHFHFILQQKEENGISKFMSLFQNSYTRYFNTKYRRVGSALQGQFKAVRVEDDYQLLHLSRYIHLNPYSSFIIKDKEDLSRYMWSSFQEYINDQGNQLCKKEIVLANFPNSEAYKKFVYDQASYQRELETIKHLLLEDYMPHG